jgi:hypothetical protein
MTSPHKCEKKVRGAKRRGRASTNQAARAPVGGAGTAEWRSTDVERQRYSTQRGTRPR